MTWKPHVTVAAVVERDGRFLMVEEQADGELVLNQPAGHLEPDESLVEAAVRETREETGWHLQPEALTGIYRWVHPTKGITFLRFCFTGPCMPPSGAPQLDHGIVRVLWLTREELTAQPQRLRSPLVLRGIDDYLSGRRVPLDVLNEVGG